MPLKVVFKSANNKLSDLDSHSLGRVAFQALTGGQIELFKDPSGRPFVDGGYCSISHTAFAGAAAASSLPIGIDLEQIRIRDPSLLAVIATPQEQGYFESYGLGAVTAIWVIKEAVAKASGISVWEPMRFSISLSERLFSVLVGETWWAVQLEQINGHFLGIAVPWGTNIPDVEWV